MTSNDDIKQAAFRLFATRGYQCTSMQDIAQAVGLKKQSLYSHFSGKQELYEIIQQEQTRHIMSELLIAVDRLENETTEKLLKGVFKCLIDIFQCKERLLLWKRSFIIHGESEVPAMMAKPGWHFDEKLRNRLYAIISSKHAQLFDHERFHSFFLSYMLSIQGYFDWMIVKGHDESILEAFWNNIWNGINQFIN